MGIKNKQIVRLTNNLLQEELVNGKMPTVRELLSKMSYKLNETLLGGPSMKLNLAKENSSVDTKSHNETLHQIASDIDLLYEELIEQTGRIANSFMYNATQVESLNRNIEETLNELNSLILIADNTNDYVYTIYDFFNDYSNIDMVESDVDIDNGAVVLGTKVFNNVRHNSSKYTVTFVPTIYPSDIIYNTKIVGDIASTVDGNQDTMWQYIISSK
jgi:hypothetical protein